MTDQRFVTALEAIYDAALDPERWPETLTLISEACGAGYCNLFYVRNDGSYGVVVSSNISPDILTEYNTEWWKHDLRAHRGMQQEYAHWRDAQTDLDLITAEELEQSPFYSDFLRKYGMKLFMTIGVSPDPRVRVALSVQFKLEKDDVTDQDLSRLERIAPHVENALRLSLKLQTDTLINEGLKQALAGLDIGVVLLDANGHMLFANAVAVELLSPHGATQGRAPNFGAGDVQRKALAAFGSLLNGDARGSMPNPVLLENPDGYVNAVLYALPISKPVSSEDEFLMNASVVLLAVPTEIGAPPEPALVRDLLGLTLGEAKVAALVGSGQTPLQASESLGIKEDTVRSALKKIFAKVGISRQSELTAMLTRLVMR